MTPAVANLALARDTDYEVALLIQDAAGQPINLTDVDLAATLKPTSGTDAAPLDVVLQDAVGGLVKVGIPAQSVGMLDWELWMQATADTPRERIVRGMVTVDKRVDPRAEGNPSTHRLIVRISDAVKVSLDSVDLAWWAYDHARLALGSQYADDAREAADVAGASRVGAETSAASAWRSAASADASASGAASSARAALVSASDAQAAQEIAQGAARNADASAADTLALAEAAGRSASDAAGDAATVAQLLDGFNLAVGTVRTAPYGSPGGVTAMPGSTPGSHVLDFVLVCGPRGDKGDPGTLANNAGDVTVGGQITAAGATINGVINASGGVRVPVDPVSDTSVVRKSDLSRPLFLPEGNTSDTLGQNLFIRHGRPTTYFGHLVNLDDPVLILQNCIQQDDNWSGYMYGAWTVVLDLCAYRIDHPQGGARNTRPGGVHCQWGRLYNANPVSAALPANRYDMALAVGDGWRDYPGGSPMIWPASTGGDGKQRCGFVAGFRNDLLGGRHRDYLYAVMPSDWVRLIAYAPGYNDNYGSIRDRQRVNNIYQFAQDVRGGVHYIGFTNNQGWADYALAMSRHGRDGVRGMTLHNGDVFNLGPRCICIHEGMGDKTTGRYPVSRSLFKLSAAAQVVSTVITLEDKTCQVVATPDWIGVDNDEGRLDLALGLNDTEAERLGLVDVAVSNGLTYTIVIYQQAQ